MASQIAIDILKKGGSAVDAAIAANAALGLMEPVLNGIGGDCFVIVWDPKTKQLYGYNGSGPSAKGRDLDKMRGEVAAAYKKAGLPAESHIPAVGSLPITVPGTVDTWFALHEKFGKLPIADDLAPAIGYAKNGFPVTQLVAKYWKGNMASFDKYHLLIEESANARATYLIDGHAPVEGEVFRNPDLANTLSLIAQGGRDAFYKGPIAHVIGDYMKAQGGFLSYEDMAAHHGEWVEPVSTNYRGYDVWELPPNGQGIATLQMLNILEGFDFSKIPFDSTEHIHLFVEAKKLAFADRARFYADPDFAKTPIKGLLSKDYAAERRKLISMDRAARVVAPGTPPALDAGDTIYLTTADASGMMVSLIQSNYRGMGSGMTPPGLGFILQDRGEMFVLKDGHPNSFAPGKRPFHTIIPAFVTRDGKPWLSFGVMGGAMQPQGHVQILMNLIDFGMNLQEAGDAPRIQHDGDTEPTGQNTAMSDGGEVDLETGFSWETIRGLMRMGHSVRYSDGPYGGYQAIEVNPNGGWIGASESRKDGQAAGY